MSEAAPQAQCGSRTELSRLSWLFQQLLNLLNGSHVLGLSPPTGVVV